MSKDLLYRTVLRCGLLDSPSLISGHVDGSPITNLTNSLLGTTLNNTPCKRLSLSSSISSCTPDFVKDLSLSDLSDSSFVCPVPVKIGCQENSPLSPNQFGESPCNKENFPTPYYSPSHSLLTRHQQTPLREVQNTATRNLSFSPLKQIISPSRREHLSPTKAPTPPDECDSSSRDSGYSESGQKKDGFNIPRSCAPTRKLNLDMSPHYSPFKSPSGDFKARSFSSLKKKSEGDDEFLMEFICGAEDDHHDAENSLAFTSLLSAPIQAKAQPSTSTLVSISPRLPIRRCLSLVDTSTSATSQVKINFAVKKCQPSLSCASVKDLFGTASSKRPASPSTVDAKRQKVNNVDGSSDDSKSRMMKENKPQSSHPRTERQLSLQTVSGTLTSDKICTQRSHSESHVSIMKALNVSSNHSGELTGDFAQVLSLPLIQGGKHPDLRSISIHTLANVLRGAYKDKITSVKILDCRYPYEYEGGHVSTAENFHHPKMIYDHLGSQIKPPSLPQKDAPRNILVFHCEFSAERAPRAQRMLREIDRTMNKDHYPALHFPEMYLLEGGYKAFYEAYPELCTPLSYVKMLDEKHTDDFKFFRSKSKSWAAENRQGRCVVSRAGLKRLGL